MDSRKLQFLQAILGNDGASALLKAAERSSSLGTVLLPRVIIAWLGVVARGDYEGSIPGNQNSYICFKKSEQDSYSGSVSIGEGVYSFDGATVIHLAATVAVALGVDDERVDPEVRALDLQRLGKNIDTLAKARIAIAELQKMRNEHNDLTKSIRAIPLGRPLPNGSHDYSHVLDPAHRQAGYSIVVRYDQPTATSKAFLKQGPLTVGEASAFHEDEGRINIADVEIPDERHRGKGLGQAMYESLMAHGVHHLGSHTVSGNVHSTMASRVHQKLAAKHGMKYKAVDTPFPALASPRPGPYDNKMGPYKYAIKGEMDMAKSPKNTNSHGGAEEPGPQAEPRAPGAPNAPLAPQANQSQKGPTVGLRPKAPSLPSPPPPAIPQRGSSQQQKKPDSPTLTVSKSQASVACSVCGGHQFEADSFCGCLCFRSLSKNVQSTVLADGYRLTFGNSWDREAICTLSEAFEGRQ